MNTTLEKFGYPNTCLVESKYWCVLLRPVQATLGSMVIVYKNASVYTVSEISIESFSEFTALCQVIEKTLSVEFNAKKFNYLALMMLDPHVHFHVLPRYEMSPKFANKEFPDKQWPGPPDILNDINLDPDTFDILKNFLQTQFLNSESSHLHN